MVPMENNIKSGVSRESADKGDAEAWPDNELLEDVQYFSRREY